jgi:hypothetical protein
MTTPARVVIPSEQREPRDLSVLVFAAEVVVGETPRLWLY